MERRKVKKEKKEGFWKRERSSFFAFCCFFVVLVVFSGLTLWWGRSAGYSTGHDDGYAEGYAEMDSFFIRNLEEFIEKEKEVNCKGINNFFSGEGFYGDYFKMEKVYDSCYDHKGFNSNKILTPQDLFECRSDFRCSSFSHSVMCLASLYDIDCKFYNQKSFYTYSMKEVWHKGIHCFTKDSSSDGAKWVKFN